MAAKSQKNRLGWTNDSLLSRAMEFKTAEGRTAEVFVHLGKTASVPKDWQESFANSEAAANAAIRVSDSAGGVRMLVAPRAALEVETDPRLKSSLNTRIRDVVGQSLGQLERMDVRAVHFGFDLPSENLDAAILGLEMALYRFKRALKNEDPKFKITLSHKGKALTAKSLAGGVNLGRAVNLARHLVNLPPNFLTPVSYAGFIEDLFRGVKNVKVEVWDEVRMKKENMGLHLGVGEGSAFPPRLVCIRYRNGSGAAKNGPIAFVGKGITFDSGGLDIKPASGMRLMKKDMGGSAAVAALALWAANSGYKGSADFYLALAENSISGASMRPSDVITARNGTTVEIHNTDAEGRLVLADALDVAVTAKEKPRIVIDVATLTGAIKVALGAALTGLFANDAKLAVQLEKAGQETGDPAWIMPLLQKYRSTFNSPFADIVNSVDGFGGAITAALFLEKFAKDVPWAHLDIYAWKDSAEGACLESGGSGQAVFSLAKWLSTQ